MKKYVKRLLALSLVMVMLVTNSLPANAARKHNHYNDVHASHVQMADSNLHISELSDDIFDAIADYLAKNKEVKSAFGKTVEGYNTEALKDAIWKSIFVDRQFGLVDFKGLGISKETAEGLTEEVIAEANAEEAVTFAVEEDANGDATVMNVAVDPIYAEAYAEIEKATANVEAAAEGDEQQTEQQQPTMEDAIAAFNEYQGFIDANPDIFGITVPYNSVKDDANEGGGPITSLITIANEPMTVDMDGDGVAETETSLLEMFKAGYVPASDIMQIIQMFHMGNMLGAQLLGEEVGTTLQKAMNDMPSGLTDVQKFLFLNDWLADLASFDMASIMELEAPTPAEHPMYQTLIYVLTSDDVGLPQADAEALAPNIIGLWGGTQFGVMSESMGYKGVCMAYTYAYAYLVQNVFSNVYRNADGTWKTRLELNYIPNPAKAPIEASVMDNYAAVVAEGDDTDPEHTHTYGKPEVAFSEDKATATFTFTCTAEDCTKDETATVVETVDTKYEVTTAPTCGKAGVGTYTATFEEYTETTDVEIPATGEHVYGEPTWSWTDEPDEPTVTAKATYTCTCGATKEEAATVEVGSRTESTCTEAGSVTYVATAGEETNKYTNEYTVTLELADHQYGEDDKCTVCGALAEGHTHAYGEPTWSAWTEEGTTTATFTCKCGDSYQGEVNYEEVVTAVTCTTDGYTTVTASVSVVNGNATTVYTNPTTLTKDEVEATGHTFNHEVAPTRWDWTEDYSACTAVYVCANANCPGGEGSEESHAATVTTTRTEPNCREAGKITHTARLILEGESFENVEEETIPALGHTYEDGVCTVCGAREADYIWSPDAPAIVDFVRISYDAAVTMYGEPQPNFESDHYWNAVKVDGQWFYVDPCYTDIYVECMIRDRVETAGNMSHLYFMFSHTSTEALYEGNYKSIDSLYTNVATDKTYEKAWFAYSRSPITFSGKNAYYFYDSTDMIELTTNNQNYNQDDTQYKLVQHAVSGDDTANEFNTLIDFVEGQVRVVEDGVAKMVDNDLIAQLTEEHNAYQEEYPSIGISCDVYDNKVYFNLANCILYYDLNTSEVVKVMEYNEVTAERDLTEGLGGIAFTVIDEITEDTVTEHNGEDTVITVKDNPIASMTIIDGQMIVSIGTTLGFISGRKSMSDEDTSIGYQFEETHYNPGYVEYVMSNGQVGEDGDNDNDEFMWSANFIDTIDMAHLTDDEHTYAPVYVEATCGENAYHEMRCEDCGFIKEGTRVDEEGTALEHHYREFNETYYTKTGDAWNTGTCYVCTICKDAMSVEDFEEEGLKASAHNHVAHVTAWNADYTEATVDLGCAACYGVNYDCVVEDETVTYATGLKTKDIERERVRVIVDHNDEEVFVATYYDYTVTVEYEGQTYIGKDRVAREADKYDKIIFTDVPTDPESGNAWYLDALIWATDNDIVAGYKEADGTYTFHPTETCVRAQGAAFVHRATGNEEPSRNAKNNFTDVESDDWFYEDVLWGAENGIVAGFEMPDGTFEFQPNGACTRAQILAFICRAKGDLKPSANAKNPFTDVEEDEWYYDNVLWAVEEGIVSGYEEADGTFTFQPEKTCTRAEIVMMLYKAFAK